MTRPPQCTLDARAQAEARGLWNPDDVEWGRMTQGEKQAYFVCMEFDNPEGLERLRKKIQEVQKP